MAPGWRDTGWTVCGPAGEVLWVLLQTAQGGRGETESTWAGTWKELTQPHVATELTSLRDSTGPHDGLKAPALRGRGGPVGPVLPRYWDQPIREASRAAVGTAQMLGPLGSCGLSASTPQAKRPRAAGSGCAQPTCKARPARARRPRSALLVGSATEAKAVGLPGWHPPHPGLGDLRRKGESPPGHSG